MSEDQLFDSTFEKNTVFHLKTTIFFRKHARLLCPIYTEF